MIVVASSDLAPVITAIAGLITVVGGIVIQIVMTVRQNKKIETNHEEVMEQVIVNGTSGIKEAGPDHS